MHEGERLRDFRGHTWRRLAIWASGSCARALGRLQRLIPARSRVRHDQVASPDPTRSSHGERPNPSNVQLLATLAAREFGWLGLQEFTQRLEGVLDEIARRAMHEQPVSRRILHPAVHGEEARSRDNGLAVQLQTLQQACLSLRASPLLSPRALQAPRETLGLVREALDAETGAGRMAVSCNAQARCTLSRAEHELQGDAGTLDEAGVRLAQAFAIVGELMDEGEEWLPGVAYRGLARVRRDIASHLQDLGLALATPASACATASVPVPLPVDATLATLSLAHRAAGNPLAAQAIEELSSCLITLAGRCECLSQELSPG